VGKNRFVFEDCLQKVLVGNMSLRFILGLPQSGKTHRIFTEIAKELARGAQGPDGPLPPLLLIVPEQFSMSAEKKLVSMLPEPAVTRAQVLSFRRLAYHLFARTGAAGGAFLDDAGKAMLMRKVLLDIRGGLGFYKRAADKPGFAGLMQEQIAEFRQYGVGPEAIARAFPESSKFADIRLIFESYADARARFYSNDDALSFVPQKIEESGFYDGAEVWIDGFFGFTPQERGVIRALLKRCARVSVSLTMDAAAPDFGDNVEQFPYEPAESDFFRETKDTAFRLAALANEAGAAAEPPLLLKRAHPSPELDFFVNNWQNRRVYRGEVKNIRLAAAESRREEVRVLADEILRLCREGHRYRDIGVIACGPEYGKELRGTFRRYGIPLFMDEKTDVFCHPLTELVRSAVEICAYNRGRESVFRFLKTGLAGLSRDETDVLENYVLARGVAGYKWDLDWDAPEEVLRARERFFAAVAPLAEALGKGVFGGDRRYPVRAVCEALFDMLGRLDVQAVLERKLERIEAAGGAEDARGYGQVLGKVTGILDRMAEILGGEAVTVGEFGRILDAGLESADLGVIPPSADQVLAGDFERSRFPEIKTLCVLGANADSLPPPIKDGGVLSDEERREFRAKDLEIAPDGRRRAFDERMRIYCGLAKPLQGLILIYREKEAAAAVGNLRRMFPGLAAPAYAGAMPPAGPLTERLCAMLGAYARGAEMPEDYARAYGLLRQRPEQAAFLARLERLILDRAAGRRVALGREAVAALYGKVLNAGVSRLEKYAECPFSYFMTYNLKAAERKIYEVESVDVGSLFHAVLEKVSRALAEPGNGLSNRDILKDKENSQVDVERFLTWRNLGRSDIAALVDGAVEELAPAVGDRLFYSTERRRYMLTKVKRICGKSVWALAEHIRRGAFEPLGAEVVFGGGSYERAEEAYEAYEDPEAKTRHWSQINPNCTDLSAARACTLPLPGIELPLDDGKKLALTGRIDRVDRMDAGGKTYVKIIDYKTGNVRFSLDDVYLGAQLQLFVYMNALIKNGAPVLGARAERLSPGGLFYFNIDDPIVEDRGGYENGTEEGGAGAEEGKSAGGKGAAAAGGRMETNKGAGSGGADAEEGKSASGKGAAASGFMEIGAVSGEGERANGKSMAAGGDIIKTNEGAGSGGAAAGESAGGDPEKASAALDALTLRSFRMSGLVLAEPDVIAGIDGKAAGDSPVAPIYVKKDGSLGGRSSAADTERFGQLLEAADEVAKALGEGIFSGDITPLPVKRGARTGCDFCGYGAVCGFDREAGRYRTRG